MFNRREFLTTAGAFALGGCKFGEVARIANPHPDFIWSDLVHFGHHMWGDVDTGKKPERKGIMTHVLTDEEFEAIMREEEDRQSGRTTTAQQIVAEGELNENEESPQKIIREALEGEPDIVYKIGAVKKAL